MPAPQEILKLIERFERNRESYLSGDYKEAQIRVEFIDPFFKILGWDVYNEQGYAEAYKDVIHEDSIKIGSATEAPDYCFRIGGARKFFLEAKKPSVNIKDAIHPAYQLRRYAWSSKLPLSVLTDFEEFSIYDCRFKPDKNDSAAAGRIMYLKYNDYPDRWNDIFSIFSRESILKGSFDKYADGVKGKKGTASVDDSFLSEIENWRDILAKNIAVRNFQLTQRELNFAVQKTIDRIIFLRICEDRGIESYGKLGSFKNGANIYKRLLEYFCSADERYNSGLFHFRSEKDRNEEPDYLTRNINIDDKVLKEIIGNFYYPECPYEFSVFPSDILGQVYEKFLGKVIRLTAGHQAKVEEKPEVRKAGGVYYTPTYIVDYIVENTVCKLLEGRKVDSKVPLRVADIACGSGSFLIVAYQKLLDWYLKKYTGKTPESYAKGKNPRIRRDRNGEWKLTINERKRILLEHIYGVDIDSQAVEVTKLSLLLKVLEEENEEIFQGLLFHERALPDLGKNIKCGNSLIGNDFYANRQGDLFNEDEMIRVNAFDWESQFPEVFKDGGFDVVIGNPPYVLIGLTNMSEEMVNYLDKYNVSQYKTDLYHLFIQKGIELLKTKGLLGYIVPNTWLTLKFTEKLRRYVSSKCLVREIILFEHFVFENVNVHTCVPILEKNSKTENHEVLLRQVKSASCSSDIYAVIPFKTKQASWISSDGCIFETRLINEAGKLASNLISKFPRLDTFFRASLGCQAYNSSKHTKEQIENRVFHSISKVGEEYLPELAGNDVSRYFIERKKGKWIKYGPWLHDYRTMDWLKGARILIREIPSKPPHQFNACYVEDTYCHYKTILNVNPSENTNVSMKYLCGILNSRLISFIYPFTSNKIVVNIFPRISVGDLKKLPIPPINMLNSTDKKQHDSMVNKVTKMLDLHKKLAEAKVPDTKTMLQRQIEATDKEIDRLVYELYGLTADEIKIVEGAK